MDAILAAFVKKLKEGWAEKLGEAVQAGIIDKSKDILVGQVVGLCEAPVSVAHAQDAKENVLNESKNGDSIKLTFCKGMLSVLTDQLRKIDTKIDKLLIKDLKSAILNLNNAANALQMPTPDIELFKDYIKIADNKATDAIAVVPNLNNKLNAYCIRIITQYLRYSDFGNNMLNGNYQIYNILNEMNDNKELLDDINKVLDSMWYWTSIEKYNLKLLCNFAIKIEELISTFTNNTSKYKIRIQANSESKNNEEDSKDNNQMLTDSDFIKQNKLVLKTLFPNMDKNSKQVDIVLNGQSWCPKIMESQFLGMGKAFKNNRYNIKHILDLFDIKNSKKIEFENQRYYISKLLKIKSIWNDEQKFSKLHPLFQHIIRSDDTLRSYWSNGSNDANYIIVNTNVIERGYYCHDIENGKKENFKIKDVSPFWTVRDIFSMALGDVINYYSAGQAIATLKVTHNHWKYDKNRYTIFNGSVARLTNMSLFDLKLRNRAVINLLFSSTYHREKNNINTHTGRAKTTFRTWWTYEICISEHDRKVDDNGNNNDMMKKSDGNNSNNNDNNKRFF